MGYAAYVGGLLAGREAGDATPIGTFLAARLDEAGFALLLFVGLGAVLGAWLARGRWMLAGALLYVGLIVTVLGFVLYSLTVALPRHPGPLNVLLFAAESLSLAFVVIYAYYTIDRVSRRTWTRHYASIPRVPNAFPFVEFHVPVYNEPTHVVMEVLDHLLRMDYPHDRYRVVVADDSTDEDARRELQAFTREHAGRVRYVHREERSGFKAGALNRVLGESGEEVELVAVIDADYKADPSFLKETVGYFEENPKLGFLQTPQDFHNVDYSPFTRAIYLANRFFFDAIMPARNEVNSIIFCGTMGIVRRRALAEAGGWGEDVLTEDAETSIRMTAKGWEGLYVPKVYGRGMLPQSFGAYKSQQYRWAFGGAQTLAKHALKILFSRLSGRQRVDLLTGALHYFSGALLTVIACVLLLFGLAEVMGAPISNFHKGEAALVGMVPFFVTIEGILRMRSALGKTLGLGLGDTLQVLGAWFSVSFLTTLAAMRALAGSEEKFVRTPKFRARKVGWLVACARALRLTRFESAMAWWLGVTGVALVFGEASAGSDASFASLALAFWLLWYACVFACGPIYAARGSRGPA